jgi:hypothetical protein
MNRRQSQPTWTNVKAKLADFDRKALLDLCHDLYAANKDNQTLLHTRFGLGGDVLEPYKDVIARSLAPDVHRGNAKISVVDAKHAIASYKRAGGDPAGQAELMVFWCEQSAGFSAEYGYGEDGYFDALCRMFEQALSIATTLPPATRAALLARLKKTCKISHQFGYGVGDSMDYLLSKSEEPASGKRGK